MALFARRKHGEVTFTESDSFALLNRPLKSSGVLIYDAPDHLVKRTLSPKKETLDLDHGRITLRRERRQWHLELSAYPQIVPYVDALRATLAGDRAALRRMFTVELAGGLANWTLELRPIEPRVEKTLRLIRIAGARDDIRSVLILQRNGDRSLMRLGPPPPP